MQSEVVPKGHGRVLRSIARLKSTYGYKSSVESDAKKAMDNLELSLKEIYDIPSKHYIHKHFILTKSDEIANIFAKESVTRKKKIAEIVTGIDPTLGVKMNQGLGL